MPVELYRQHPDQHHPWTEWSEEQTLHVAVCYSNPFRWKTRRALANDCIRHLRATPNVRLHVGELAYGDRPFEITVPGDIQLRTQHELFHKENILNRVIQTFLPDWKYGAYVDADFHLTRRDWALETIHQLQHHDFVQPFSSYADLTGESLGTGHLPIRINTGFAFNYVQNGYRLPGGYSDGGWKQKSYSYATAGARRGVGATGGMWAFRRPAFDTVGGLLDKCILGHGDWFMAFGLVCEEVPDVHLGNYSADYRAAIAAWQGSASKLKQNIGYVDGFAVHHFHGSKVRRAYSHRDLILVRHQFVPTTDLRPDWQGIYQLTPDKPQLRDEIRRYFLSRSEDDPNLYGSEKTLV
ncbi:MAG TPA: hypothetical protein VMT15_03710 [Bryobacteraceae bacterium]|nr:hypothetical protein [Bryobacteraceae bacterium]